MRQITFFCFAALLLTCCGDSEQQLRERAVLLCQYVPDHELREQAKDYMTADFYAVLDTMFHMPSHEAMDHEWLYYFVTGNGGSIADFEVQGVEMTDKTHAIATVLVRQQWEDGSFDAGNDVEQHRLYMEKVGGKWLMSDFDEHKADCIRHIAINRREQAVRQAVSDYLVQQIGARYLQGQLCVPAMTIINEEDTCLWGDFWIFWYNISGDTLKTVSGGNHTGKMTLRHTDDGAVYVSHFESTEDGAGYDASARRIFGEYYDEYQALHANETVREAVRREQLEQYVRDNKYDVHYYQDYGWPAQEL